MADPAAGPPADPGNLPASLSALYPPQAKQPVFLQAMLELNATLAGIPVDLFENDREGVQTGFEGFRSRYQAAAALVPEWKDRYPGEPVDALGNALREGTPDAVMAALGKVGGVCHDCHVAAMVPVQQKYRWPDFGAITVQDPVRNAHLSYPEFMQMLNTNLAGIGLDLGEGQLENARAQFQALRARMGALKESCGTCHETKRAYFVDASIDAVLDRMGAALNGDVVDPGVMGQLGQALGTQSCSNCHLVHLPAAYARR
jgi:hypothetical protein